MKRTKRILATMLTTACLCWGAGDALATTILYVPQDDRPVDLEYTVATAEEAGYQVLTPPPHLLSGRNFHGEADQLWQWVDQNASRADFMVLSTDSLIYGGLVDSRKHYTPFGTLAKRLENIKTLRQRFPSVPIYAFGTVMRSPRASAGGVEPEYYATYGPSIFAISALQDKLDFEGLSTAETAKLISLMSTVPIEYLQDWFQRRNINMTVNQRLIGFARDHVFNYFALGHDDTSYRSQSDLEARYLRQYSKGIPATEYGSFPGADQLGLLLIARAHVERNHLEPTFEVFYPLGGEEHTIPHYEDQPIGLTIAQHVEVAGGKMVTKGRPDYLLAVNTPLSRETGESEAFENMAMPSPSLQRFVKHIKEAIDEGVPVSVADISYSNGSDNRLLYEMKKYDLLYRVAAYNGWNTASNTVGYAIAQAILSKSMTPSAHRDMLTQQYMDNWAYQANIRKKMSLLQDQVATGNVKYTGQLAPEVYEALQVQMQDFAEKELGVDPRKIQATFPWGRLFETGVTVYPTPRVPLQREVIAERERAAAEAKAKAEAEAKAKAEAEAKAKAKAAAEKDMPKTQGNSIPVRKAS